MAMKDQQGSGSGWGRAWRLAVVVPLLLGLGGCASFHASRPFNPEAAYAAMRAANQQQPATVSLRVSQGTDPNWGCGDTVLPPLKAAMEKSLAAAGFQPVENGAGRFQVHARATRCDYGPGAGTPDAGLLSVLLSGFTLFVVPAWVEAELHVEVSISEAGKPVYKDSQRTSGHYLGGWLALPFMVTNAKMHWLGEATQAVSDQHIVEMDEQGLF